MNWKSIVVWSTWLAAPAVALAWHYGPGQKQDRRDRASEQIRQANAAMKAENWPEATVGLLAAQAIWPGEDTDEVGRIALASAKTLIQSGELIAGQEMMQQLVSELESMPNRSESLLSSARHELGTSSYYAAWMMRLEGATTEEWMVEAEASRQQFRLLAEECSFKESDTYEAASKNVEAVIRLEQMDLATLLARPLPKNCCSNCNGLCQKKRERTANQCKNSGTKKDSEPQDAREKIKESNSAGGHGNYGNGS